MADNLPMLGLSAGFYALIVCLTFVLAKALRMSADKGHVFMFCFIFGNTGFVGIPLMSAVFPDLGLLYLSLFGIVDTPVFWTLGVWLATSKDRRHEHFEGIGSTPKQRRSQSWEIEQLSRRKTASSACTYTIPRNRLSREIRIPPDESPGLSHSSA